jgi:hypothetical protein
MSGQGLATSFYAVVVPSKNQPDRNINNHILFAWKFDQVSMLPFTP